MRRTLLLFVYATVCPAAVLHLASTVTGQAGGYVGWGYAMQDNLGYAVPTYSEFSSPTSDGQYVDFVSLPANYVIVLPVAAGGQSFNEQQQTGIGDFFIDPVTPDGDVIYGTITLHYDLYSNNPNLDPNSFLSGDQTVSAPVSIDVSGLAVPTPEPGSCGLAVLGLALFAGFGAFMDSHQRCGRHGATIRNTLPIRSRCYRSCGGGRADRQRRTWR